MLDVCKAVFSSDVCEFYSLILSKFGPRFALFLMELVIVFDIIRVDLCRQLRLILAGIRAVCKARENASALKHLVNLRVSDLFRHPVESRSRKYQIKAVLRKLHIFELARND